MPKAVVATMREKSEGGVSSLVGGVEDEEVAAVAAQRAWIEARSCWGRPAW